MILHKPHEAGEPDPLNLNRESDRVLTLAETFAYHVSAGDADRALQAICRLRSCCDYLARDLVQRELSPLQKAKCDLERIRTAKEVARVTTR